MTRYTVTWMDGAIDDLASIWMQEIDRDAISAAAYSIDQQLRIDAPLQGMDEGDGLRSLLISPLIAIFRVREEDRIAEVARIRLE